jgi:GNAT superfamily N-acetyltransferase
MSAADLPCVMAIQAEAYAAADFAPEQPAVFHDRMALAPALHSALGRLPPAANCWYLHDCAVASRAHGQGMAAALYAPALAQARAHGLVRGALVAVGDAAGYWERLGYRARALGAGQTKLAAYGAGARYMVRALD